MFVVLTLVIPLIMLVGGGIGFLTEHLAHSETAHLSVLDKTENFYPYLEEQAANSALEVKPYRGEASRDGYLEEVQNQETDGVLVVSRRQLEEGRLELYVDENSDFSTALIREPVNNAAATYRLQQLGLDPEEVYTAIAPVEVDTRTINGEEKSMVDIIIPLAAGGALILSVMLSGQILMYGVIKEKRNRVVELLLSSISSLELLLGKIVGYGALSLAQIGIWVGAGLGVSLAILEMPEINITVATLLPPFLYFFFGYLMFFSIFAALGATMKEAEGGSQAQGLIVIIPVLPLMFSGPLLQAPNAWWAQLISYIPFFTPTTVLLRMGGTSLPLWEIIITLIILILSTALFIFLGARIFEGTILQYDRSAGIKDLKMLFAKKPQNQ